MPLEDLTVLKHGALHDILDQCKNSGSEVRGMIGKSIDQAMLDAAITLTIPPMDVYPYFDMASKEQDLIRQIKESMDRNAARLQEYIRKSEDVKIFLREIFASQPVKLYHTDELGQLIAALENRTAESAVRLILSLKALKKTFSALGDIMVWGKASFKEFYEVTAQQYWMEIDEMTNAALFLRALRAEYNSDSRGGKFFSNSTDLANYLNRSLA